MLVFDIETSPRPDNELRAMLPPFDPSAVRGIVEGEFDPASVKCGAMKDEAKIAAKIEAARAEFEAAKANSANILAAAELDHWSNFVSKAALSPVTGYVLAIGFYNPDGDKVGIAGADSPADEPKLLADFWTKYRACRVGNRQQYGFNIFRFDLPFMVRRSWLLGVDVPDTLLAAGGRYFDPLFVDLLSRWQFGAGWNDSISLDELARFFGVGGKPDGVNGAHFARLWAECRDEATAYLVNDLKITAACAARMGVV